MKRDGECQLFEQDIFARCLLEIAYQMIIAILKGASQLCAQGKQGLVVLTRKYYQFYQVRGSQY